MPAPTSVISSEYCLPHPIKLTIDTDKDVTYFNGGVIFRVEEPSFSLHKRRVLHDVSGKPVLTWYKKRVTMHGRWEVFKHASSNSDDLLFSVKRPSLLKPHKKNINLEVFLAENTKESVCDFKINACASKKSCYVCAHGSSTILAEMTNKVEVEVQPNVDYAFIVALLTIVHEIDNHFDINASEATGDTAQSMWWGLNTGANVADIVMNCFQ